MPLLRNISQLATCPSGNPQQDAGLIRDAALVWRNGLIRWAGRYADLPSRYAAEPVIDCERRLVVPGLVDCHTHLCFGGWRGDEFEARLEGATYQDIAAAGGGIAHTVAATRRSSIGELQRKAKAALDAMLRLGVTTVECKSGYGLDEANELKQLEVYRRLDLEHPVDLVPTFLGAHIIPPEHREHPDRYVRLLCGTRIPRVASLNLARFCDVFVEDGAYSVADARRILGAAQDHGLGLKIHADQLSAGGGALLAAEMGAVSAEHLEYVTPEAIPALAAHTRRLHWQRLTLKNLHLSEQRFDLLELERIYGGLKTSNSVQARTRVNDVSLYRINRINFECVAFEKVGIIRIECCTSHEFQG